MCGKQLNPTHRLLRIEGLPAAFTSYCSHIQRRGMSLRTMETYADCLRLFAGWLRMVGINDPVRARHADLLRFQSWLANEYMSRGRTISAARQATYVAVIRQFYRFLASESLVLSDPSEVLKIPKIPVRLHRDVLSAVELRRLLEGTDDSPRGLRDGAVLRLLALSGPRTSELSRVNVDDLDLDRRELVIRKGKGNKQRLVFFDSGTREHLARYLLRGRPRLAGSGQTALLVDDRGFRASAPTLRGIVALRSPSGCAACLSGGPSVRCCSLAERISRSLPSLPATSVLPPPHAMRA